jgi:hypothetical protein
MLKKNLNYLIIFIAQRISLKCHSWYFYLCVDYHKHLAICLIFLLYKDKLEIQHLKKDFIKE